MPDSIHPAFDGIFVQAFISRDKQFFLWPLLSISALSSSDAGANVQTGCTGSANTAKAGACN
jgi:hypothetical protein